MTVRYTSNISQVKKQISKTAGERAFRCANAVKTEWVKLLSGQGKGRIYRVPGTQKTYQASAPGDPPAVLFGDLKRSPEIKVWSNGSGYQVGSNLLKALWLEKGTSQMKPRPSLKPAYNKAKPELKRILERRWL